MMSCQNIKRAPMRTYSRRVLKDSSEPPFKKVCVASTESSPALEIPSKEPPAAPIIPAKKRSIADYFQSQSSQSSLTSQDVDLTCQQQAQHTYSSPLSSFDTPPSSPPPLEPIEKYIDRPKRARRRLTTRPQLIQSYNMESTGDYENKIGAGSNEDLTERKSGIEDKKLGGTANEANHEKAPAIEDEKLKNVANKTSGEKMPTTVGEKDMNAGILEADIRARAHGGGKDVVGRSAHPTDIASIPSQVSPKSSVESLIPRKRRLTVQDCIIEGGLKHDADPSLANGIIFNPDGRVDKLSKQDPAEYVITSESAKGGVRFIGTAVPEESDDHPGAIPIPAPRTWERDTESETSFKSEKASGSSSSLIFPIELDTKKPSPATKASQITTANQLASALGGKAKSTKLVQTHINLGQNPVTTCNFCKFTFNTTLEGDVKAHTKYHNDFTNRFSVAKLKIGGSNGPKKIKNWIGIMYDQYIVAVDLHSSEAWKKMAEKMIEHIERELNSQKISADKLWSTIADPGVTVGSNVVVSKSPTKLFKVYLYIVDKKVAAVLLAERVTEGLITKYGPLEADEFGAIPGECQIRLYPDYTDKVRSALLGVHYIWTHHDHRHKGYATRLLDAARHGDFIYGAHITREQLAWTATTDAGRDFAGWYITEDKYAAVWEMLIY